MITRKKKVCKGCNKETYLFSKGLCRMCANVNYIKTTKSNRRKTQANKAKKKLAKKRKAPTVTGLKKKLWRIFSQYIRLRDADPHTGMCKCITCNTVKPWKEMQAGHGVSRRFNNTLFHEQNNHAQCGKCNVLMNGEQYLYAKEVDNKYGEGTFENIIKLSRESKKFTIFELQQLITEYEEKIKKIRIKKKL